MAQIPSTEIRTLVFDTETTGKADMKKKDFAVHGVSAQPHLVQIGAVLFKGRRPLGHFSAVLIPKEARDGARVGIPAEASGVHQIFEADIDAVGMEPKIALAAFNQMLRNADRLVAHNMDFDELVTRAAYSRVAAPQDLLLNIPKVCTMRSSENILKLPGKYGYKFPSLNEAHEHFCGTPVEGAHDAMNDLLACADVLWALEDGGHPLTC